MKRTRLILFLLICGSFFFPHISASQDVSKEETKLENWIDYASDSFAGGTGTEDDPYLIATAEQLAFLAKTTNAGKSYEDSFFKLTADIDLAGKEWTPIGTVPYYESFFRKKQFFIGNFDGQNKTIFNLTIKTYLLESGLFGVMRDSFVQNTKLSNIFIDAGYQSGGITAIAAMTVISNCSVDGIIGGFIDTGGIIGYSFIAKIANCNVSIDIISNSNFNVTEFYKRGVSPEHHNVCTTGGIVGTVIGSFAETLNSLDIASEITNCSANINFQGGIGDIGGIMGRAMGIVNISNCSVLGNFNGGHFIGGIAGTHANLINCIFKGVLQGNTVGGLVGYSPGSIENCSVSGNLKADKSGGLVGFQSIGMVMPKYSSVWLNEHAGENAGIKELWGTTASGTAIMLTSPSTRYIELSPSPPISIQRSAKIPDGVSFDLGDTGFEVIPRNFVGASLDVAGRYLVISGTTVALEGSYQIFAVKSPDVLVIPLDIF